MPTTLVHNISYPSGSSTPNVPLSMQTTAESVEAAIENLNIKNTWTKLTNLNAWVDYVGGGQYRMGLWYRIEGDSLQINGMVKSGAANTIMATLPTGYRPAYTIIHGGVVTSGGLAQIQYDGSNGNITYMTGSPAAPTYVMVNVTIPFS